MLFAKKISGRENTIRIIFEKDLTPKQKSVIGDVLDLVVFYHLPNFKDWQRYFSQELKLGKSMVEELIVFLEKYNLRLSDLNQVSEICAKEGIFYYAIVKTLKEIQGQGQINPQLSFNKLIELIRAKESQRVAEDNIADLEPLSE